MDSEQDARVETTYYLNRRFTDPTDKERGAQPFYLRCIHNFYQRFGSSWEPGSARLLEFGGGPVIYSLISAVPFFNEITFSDYQQSNIDAVIAWKDRSQGHHDWTPYFKYVVSELEGDTSDETVSLRQEELRVKCRHFLHGDLHATDVLSSDSVPPEDFSEKFDVVSSNFCCEPVANNIKEYEANVRSLGAFVKPGGFITSLVSLEESYYYASYSDTQMFHLSIVEDDVKKAYGDAGFDIISTDICYFQESARHILNDCKAIMFIAGQKKQN